MSTQRLRRELNILILPRSVGDLKLCHAISHMVSQSCHCCCQSQVWTQASPCEMCDELSGTGTGFSQVLQFSLVSILPMLHTNLNTTLIRQTNGWNLGTLIQSNAIFDIEGTLDRKVSLFCLFFFPCFKELIGLELVCRFSWISINRLSTNLWHLGESCYRVYQGTYEQR